MVMISFNHVHNSLEIMSQRKDAVLEE